MSFILDALKKSEAERQRTNTPGIADIPSARIEPRTPRWLWIVGSLLVVNLTVLAVLLVWYGAETRPVETITKTLDTPDVAPATSERSFSDLVAEAKEKRREIETVPEPTESRPAPAVESRSPEPVTQSKPTVVSSARTLNELRATGVLQLPDLHLDLHVYSETPSNRFILVNMTKYAEGATLKEGPRVTEITPDGVLLEHQGVAFLLPRQ